MSISSLMPVEPIEVLKQKRNLNAAEVEVLGNHYLGIKDDNIPKNSVGDVIVDGYVGEYKKVGQNSRTLESSDTINQVRAIKCNFLIIYSTVHFSWFIVPAHIVVKLVKDKKRGQHTEIPFECSTLSLKAVMEQEGVYSVDALAAEKKLLPTVRKVIADSQIKSNRKYLDCMTLLYNKIQGLKEEFNFIVDRIL